MRNIKKTAMLALMFLILLSISALAVTNVTVEKRLPTIKAEFDQSVTLVSYSLADSTANEIGLELV